MVATVAHMTEELKDSAVPRWVWLLAGTAAAVAGVRRSGVSGALLCGVGGALVSQYFTPGGNTKLSPFARGTRLRTSIFVNASPDACYRSWRRLEDLPQYVDYLQRVEVISPSRSVWVTKSVAGRDLRWEAEITRDVPGELIGWRSMPGSQMNTSGSIRFVGKNEGTLVTITMKYGTDSVLLENALFTLLGNDPERQIETMLWRFKQAVEDGCRIPARTVGDPVDEVIDDSFPASDPPSWNP